MMLETLSFISSKLKWLRPVVMLFGLIFLGLFCSSLFDIGHFIEEVYLIPSLAGLIWSVLFFILLNALKNIPIKPGSKFVLFSNNRILSAIFLLMTIAGLILSFRLFSVWFTN
jgi:hypothetical protein